jgi:hypothetical protein
MQSGLSANKIDRRPFVNSHVPSLIVENSPSMNVITIGANKIEGNPLVNDQVPYLIVEELPFNKFHHDSVPIKSNESLS